MLPIIVDIFTKSRGIVFGSASITSLLSLRTSPMVITTWITWSCCNVFLWFYYADIKNIIFFWFHLFVCMIYLQSLFVVRMLEIGLIVYFELEFWFLFLLVLLFLITTLCWHGWYFNFFFLHLHLHLYLLKSCTI